MNGRRCCYPLVTVVVLFLFGLACILCGVFLPAVFENLIKEKVNEAVILKEGSLGYKEWKKPTSPVYLQFFMYNLTNHEEVLKGGKPRLHQVGPYSYREIRKNDVLSWNSNNTVKYNEIKTYIFDRETSCEGCDDINDEVMTVNVVITTLMEVLKHFKGDLLHWQETLDDFMKMKGETLFKSRSVRKLVWGYHDDFLEFIKDYVPPFLLPGKIDPFVRYQVNNSGIDSNDSISSIFTGEGDIDKLNIYDLWRGERTLKWWGTEYANMINGTDGTHFKPRIKKDDRLDVFVDQICRSMYLKYHSTVTVHGIELYRFAVPREVYLSGDIDPNNEGFCTGKCLVTGLLNITGCQPTGAPIIISPPHFYLSSRSLLNTTEGLSSPEENEHATFIDVEPITGTTLQANKRLQINVYVEKVEHYSITGDVKTVILPVFYINESAQVSKADAEQFISQVYQPIKLTKYAIYGFYGLGGLLILISVSVYIVGLVRSRKVLLVSDDTEKLIQNTDSTLGVPSLSDAVVI